MQRWRMVFGCVWLAWHLSGLAFHHLLARHYAREILTVLPTASPETAGDLLFWSISTSDPGSPRLLSGRCFAAFHSVYLVDGKSYLSGRLSIQALQYLAAYCPSVTKPLPPDLQLAEQLLPPEVLSLVGGLLETLAVQARPGAPPTEPLLRKLVIGLVNEKQRRSEEWPTTTESQGLPADSVQFMEEAARACRSEVPGLTDYPERYDHGHRAKILWHPVIEPFVSGADEWMSECLTDAAKQVPPPDGLARLIWIGEG